MVRSATSASSRTSAASSAKIAAISVESQSGRQPRLARPAELAAVLFGATQAPELVRHGRIELDSAACRQPSAILSISSAAA
jgi:hypothetical protein